MTPERVDVAVVGGGVMGSAAAWQLASRGVETVLFERFEPGHTWGASHGASRIFRFAYPDPLYIRLARESLPLWRQLEDVTATTLLTVTGGVDHGEPADLALIAGALAAAGVPGEWLDEHEAGRRWSGLRFAGPALHHAASGRLDADAAVAAMQRAASADGADVRHRRQVTRLRPAADHVDIETADGVLRARRVVVCAGAWTSGLLPGTVPRFRVTQEQPAHFRPYDDGEWPSFIHHRGAGARPFHYAYGLRTPGEGVKVGFHVSGPDCDPDARDHRPEPVRMAALVDYVREWVPGVDPDVADPISCTYTLTPDEDWVLDAAGPVVVGAGFSGHGFKFAPLVGGLLADLAMGRTADQQALERFRIARLA